MLRSVAPHLSHWELATQPVAATFLSCLSPSLPVVPPWLIPLAHLCNASLVSLVQLHYFLPSSRLSLLPTCHLLPLLLHSLPCCHNSPALLLSSIAATALLRSSLTYPSSVCLDMSSSAALSACVSDSLLRCPAVSELLLAALSAAAAHGRLPFAQPLTLTATDQQGKKRSFVTKKAFDAAKLLATVDAIPPLDRLLSAAKDNTLAATLDAIDPLILPLLDWTLHNPDVYIRQLEPEERFAAIPTDQQYAVCMPARETSFIRVRREQAASRRVAEEAAVTFQFHGSPSHNWHSILRTGLKNLSNTQWMGSRTTAADSAPHLLAATAILAAISHSMTLCVAVCCSLSLC